jgi:cysteine synthase
LLSGIQKALDKWKTSIDKAAELVAKYGYFEVKQFENPHNPEAHELTMGPEIVEVLDHLRLLFH